MPKLLDSDGVQMTDDERQFWENTAACCLSAHLSVPDADPHFGVVERAFQWADKALERYRVRLARPSLPMPEPKYTKEIPSL